MSEPTSDWGRGSWMQTFTGRQFFPLDAAVEDVHRDDIAHGLSMICRYGGHTKRFYSVAEHCVRVSQHVPEHLALVGLLHDAAEAYVGDMVRPLKHHMPAYRAIEDRLLAVIFQRFSIDRSLVTLPHEVKAADNRILLDERNQLLSTPPQPWQQEDLEPLGITIHGWSPGVARRRFTERLSELTGGAA